MAYVCFCCKAETESSKLIKCCICSNCFKHSCVGLTLADTKAIHSKPGLSFTCSSCTNVGKDMNELKSVIVELKNEVAALKAQNNDVINNRAISGEMFNEIVQEVTERQKRTRNIIIYGIKENSNGDMATRKKHDTDCVKNVVNFVSTDVSTQDLNPIRLGKYLPDSHKPRPIRITFDNEQTVNTIIRNAKQLKGSEFRNISISFDRTPKQIEYYKTLKKQLDERISNGEANLRIKNINGVPKITSLN